MDSEDLVARIESELGSTAGRDDAPCLHPPPRVADYELMRRIGAGSYGEVWLARSVTGQWRAVKGVARDRFTSERPYEREFRGVVQFEPISRSHSGLVQVLHVGRDDAVGAFYYVMELADAERQQAGKLEGEKVGAGTGTESSPAHLPAFSPADYRPRTLRSDLKARGRLTVAEAVALGVELTGALGHIHRHGLVHRDVKPSNVIFVHGQPKLADLGLVTSADEARSFVGTEGFIPPEGPGSVKADLFALGRLLYEAATGKDRCEFPELPPDLDAWPNREEFLEFNEIVTQLCAPDPARRYANAAEVAGDLNLILAGRSVRRANGVERRLHRARQISAVALGVLAVAAGLVWFQQTRRREAEGRAAHEQTLRERAVTAEQDSRRQLYTALLEQARATVRSGEMGQRVRALDAARRAAAITNTAELRREVVAALALPDLRRERGLPFGSEFTVREFDPAFGRVALCRGRGPVEVRGVPDQRLLTTLPASTNLMAHNATWSGDGRFLAVKRDHDAEGRACDLEVWEGLEGGSRLVVRIHDARWNAWSYHPRRSQLLVAGPDGLITAWDLERGTELARRRYPVTPVALAYSPDGTSVASTYPVEKGWEVSIHEASNQGELSFTLSASHVFEARVGAIQWHPEGRVLAVTDYSGSVYLMQPRTGAVRTVGRHRAEAVMAAFDSAGDYLMTGGWERSLICWDLRAMQRAFAIELDSYALRFRADGRQCVVLTPTGVQLHAFERPEQREFAEELGPRLRHAAFSPDGQWLAASADQRLGVWDLRHQGPGALADEGFEARPFWTPDGRELFGSRDDDQSFRWRVLPAPDGAAAPTLERVELPRPRGFKSFSLVSNLVVWTTTQGSQIAGLESLAPDETAWSRTGHGNNGISPDGRWLAVHRAFSPRLYIYQLPGLEPVARLTNQAGISGFAFFPARDEVAVASRGQVEFWSTRNWERTRVLTNFTGIPFLGVLAQPGGRSWWLAKDSRTAGLYDAHTLEPQLPLPNGASPLAVSPDGRRLAVSVDARRLQVWDLARVREQLRELGLDWADAGR